jgi:hypothetical protein
MFVASQTYGADFGGLAGADSVCQTHADAAGLEGTFLAWLSDSTGSPSSRFTQSECEIYRTDGKLIASNWSDLVDGTLNEAIFYTELGTTLMGPVWTSTTAAGELDDQGTCDDWTSVSAGESTSAGSSSAKDSKWTDNTTRTCAGIGLLYCLN